jgi:hypothetical protein
MTSEPHPPGMPTRVTTKLRYPSTWSKARLAIELEARGIEFVTLLRCACGDKEVTESWVPADMCGRCGMPLRRVEVERRTS